MLHPSTDCQQKRSLQPSHALLVLCLFVAAACAPATTQPPATASTATATEAAGTAGEVEGMATTPTRAVQPTASATPEPSAPPAATPDPQALSAQLSDQMGINPDDQEGFAGVKVLELETPAGFSPLWAAFTYGFRPYDPQQNHFVALYTFGGDSWQELDRVELECGDYMDENGVQQVFIAPSRVWLTVQSGTGAHSGCFDLLNYDGTTLQLAASNFNSNPGAGGLADINGDGRPEVLLNQTENYVFCYACGVRLYDVHVLRWDGSELVDVTLTALDDTAPADLRRLNNQAVELAQGELWQAAQSTIAEAVDLSSGNPTVAWNNALIQLIGATRAQYAQDSPYPLLSHIFYGDWAAALDVVRPYSAAEIFSPQTPLVIDTPAVGWESALQDWIGTFAEAGLAVRPNLAAAYFLRGWSTYLVDPTDPSVLADVQQAAQLVPDESLYRESLAFLQSQATPQPTATPTRAPAGATVPLPVSRERIVFQPGSTVYASLATLQPDAPQGYTLRLLGGQRLFVTASGDTNIYLLDAGDRALSPFSNSEGASAFHIPSNGDYTIVLQGAGTVEIVINIPPLDDSQDLPQPQSVERVRFAVGATSATLQTTLVPGAPQGFLLGVSAGQRVYVGTDPQTAELVLLDPDGNLLTPVSGTIARKEYAIPRSGDYTLVLSGQGDVTLSIDIPPLAGPVTPPVGVEAIRFAAGATSANVAVPLTGGQPRGYSLRALANQRMILATSGLQATLTVLDPTRQPLLPALVHPDGSREYRLPQTGQYIIVLAGSGTGSLTVEIPPL